jgi:hypothetical protein
MDRAESLEWINAFVTELGGNPTQTVIPASEQPGRVETVSKKPEQVGLGGLIACYSGFEIGVSPKEKHIISQKVPSAPRAQGPDFTVVKKAIAGVNDKPLLRSLLDYYLFELRQEKKNRSMMKTTKEQIMKHWPMLTLSPLITALDGAAAE